MRIYNVIESEADKARSKGPDLSQKMTGHGLFFLGLALS